MERGPERSAALLTDPKPSPRGDGGARNQIEIGFVWDDKPGGAIRVLGSIDGGFRAFFPLAWRPLVDPPRLRASF